MTKQLVVLKCNLPKTQATEGQIEEAGGRPQKPETGGVLTGYKKVVMILFVTITICHIFLSRELIHLHLNLLTSTRQP